MSCGAGEREKEERKGYLEPLSIGQGRFHPYSKEDGCDCKDRPGQDHEDAVSLDELWYKLLATRDFSGLDLIWAEVDELRTDTWQDTQRVLSEA